jgi:inward rectifier potassium channel
MFCQIASLLLPIYYFCGAGAVTNAKPGSSGRSTSSLVCKLWPLLVMAKMTPVGVLPNCHRIPSEAFFGIVYSALTMNLAFARFTRRSAGVKFTKHALVGLHNGQQCFTFSGETFALLIL